MLRLVVKSLRYGVLRLFFLRHFVLFFVLLGKKDQGSGGEISMNLKVSDIIPTLVFDCFSFLDAFVHPEIMRTCLSILRHLRFRVLHFFLIGRETSGSQNDNREEIVFSRNRSDIPDVLGSKLESIIVYS